MSIFSNIRKSRHQAKQHSAKLAEQKEKEANSAPYRHVPTHAATDAYAAAPPSWREADRPRIAEENRRRSAMAASGHHMNMPGVPRVASSLSHVSYPASDSSRMVRLGMSRAYSYSGTSSPYIPGAYTDRGHDVLYSVPGLTYAESIPEAKGKEALRTPQSETPRISPGSSKGEHSPSRSSSSSQDDLQIKSSRPAAPSVGTSERAHRLHLRHSRRASDASVKAPAPLPPLPQQYRDPRPPPSMRGFSSIPPVPTPTTMPSSSLPAARALAVPTISPDAKNSTSSGAPPPAGMSSSRQSSAASLPALTPALPNLTPSKPVTTGTIRTPQPEFPQLAPAAPLPSIDVDFLSAHGDASTALAAPQPANKPKDRRTLRTARFTELERIESVAEPPSVEHLPGQARPVTTPQEVINVFPEAEPELEASAPPVSRTSKGKKLTKGGGRLVKKNRMSSTNPAVVAV